MTKPAEFEDISLQRLRELVALLTDGDLVPGPIDLRDMLKALLELEDIRSAAEAAVQQVEASGAR